MAYKVDESPAQRFQPLIDWESLPAGGAPALWEARCLISDEVPKRGILLSSHKRLPDIFMFKGSLLVCQSFREIVERLEPGVHQFFPFEVVSKKGEPISGDGPYCVFNPMQKFDAILVSQSNVMWMDLDESRVPGKKSLSPGRGPLQLVMSRPKIAGRHVWRGDRVFRTDLYFSDGFVEAIQAAKLKQLKYTHIEESDEHWYAEGNLTPN